MRLNNLLKLPRILKTAIQFAIRQSEKEQMSRFKPEQFAYYGSDVRIEEMVSISHPHRVHIGTGCTIQRRAIINSTGGLFLADYVGIGTNTVILTFVHNYNFSKSIPYDNINILKPVIIRDFAWIGWNSIIHPGVEIGEGAVIAMGSVITKNVPPFAIVMGNPAEVVGYRSKENFIRCKNENKINTHMNILEKYGKFEEKVPMLIKRKYENELKKMNLI